MTQFSSLGTTLEQPWHCTHRSVFFKFEILALLTVCRCVYLLSSRHACIHGGPIPGPCHSGKRFGASEVQNDTQLPVLYSFNVDERNCALFKSAGDLVRPRLLSFVHMAVRSRLVGGRVTEYVTCACTHTCIKLHVH